MKQLMIASSSADTVFDRFSDSIHIRQQVKDAIREILFSVKTLAEKSIIYDFMFDSLYEESLEEAFEDLPIEEFAYSGNHEEREEAHYETVCEYAAELVGSQLDEVNGSDYVADCAIQANCSIYQINHYPDSDTTVINPAQFDLISAYYDEDFDLPLPEHIDKIIEEMKATL